jgi:hypothetical protein
MHDFHVKNLDKDPHFLFIRILACFCNCVTLSVKDKSSFSFMKLISSVSSFHSSLPNA